MPDQTRILHLLDDLAMGGVTRALDNFLHSEVSKCGDHEIYDVKTTAPKTKNRSDIAVVHFTANWRKLPRMADLKHRKGFDRIILIEHTYTRGYEQAKVPNTQRFRRMLRIAYSMVDTVVAVSKDQRDWIVSAELAPADKVVVIPQSRDVTELIDLPVAERSEAPLLIGAFGRFHEQKGFDLLIEAMKTIPADVAQLCIAGAGEDVLRLKALALTLPNVHILKPFKSPREFLSNVDVIAIPSRWEAFGLVGTEARAAGRPLIAADVDGLKEQVGHHSFTHEVGDVSDIRRAILEAAAAKDFEARATAARVQVSAEFDALQSAWTQLLTVRVSTKTAFA